MSKKVLIIGAGGVGNVVAHKCAMHPEAFSEIMLASRNENKCKAIASDVKAATGRTIKTAAVDADNVQATVKLIKSFGRRTSHQRRPSLSRSSLNGRLSPCRDSLC
jgi:saccharopine dehydrogenase (NAD+, L-lysine-forming)